MHSIRKSSWLALACAAAFMVITPFAKSANAGMVMFEDLWPSNGDRDFNDQTVAYNFVEKFDSSNKVISMQATFNVLAVGATLHNGVYLHLPVPASSVASATLNSGTGPVPVDSVQGESDIVIPIVDDTRSLFPGSTGFINTVSGQPIQTAPTITLNIQFAAATIVPASAPFDLFIARSSDYGHQIHLPQYAGTDLMDRSLFDTGNDNSASGGLHFVNASGLPFALSVPEVIAWPAEGVPIDLAYPDIDKYFASGGTTNTDWYLTNVNPQYLYSPVPEPTSIMLLAIAGTVLASRRRAR